MHNNSSHSKLNGLNGFWGNLWGGFVSEFTSSTSDDNQSSFAGKLGRSIGGWLKRLLIAAILKTSEYVPTAQELIVLNPLKTALNNYMIAMVKELDAFFLTNNDTDARIQFLNNSIRKIQLIESYFLLNSHPSLSANAQHFMAVEIGKMVQSFELTIEEILDTNGINYIKTEGNLIVNSADTYPAGLNIPSTLKAYGFQYEVPNANSVVIKTDVVPAPATNPNVVIQPKPATVVSTVVAGSENQNKHKFLVPVVLVVIAIILALSGEKKEKKEK